MPDTMVGGYRIDGLLGRGGMAEVYKAWNVGLHRHEALKLLPPQMTFDQSFVERFLHEARTAAGLRHPHIATIHTVSPVHETQPYFTMEIVEGGDLADLLHQRGPLPLPDALPILRQIAAALDYAHRQGIIHRDVKPANILLEEDGQGERNVKMVDFGIARAQEAGDGARLTKTGMIVGTPEYMSPEQGGSGEKVSHRSDQYSLGVIAYEMLCGRPPFAVGAEGTAMTVIMAHIRDVPRAPVDFVPGLSRSANNAVLRALSKTKNRQIFEQLCSHVKSITVISNVKRLVHSGSQATVRVDREMTMMVINPRTQLLIKAVSTTEYLDGWIQIKRHWLLRTNNIISVMALFSLVFKFYCGKLCGWSLSRSPANAVAAKT